MNEVYRNHSGYFEKAFGDIDEIAGKMREELKEVKFDTMVGTGLSGTLVVPTLARAFGTYWAIVRKENSPHANGLIEGEIGQKWLFVDDFICSGATLERVRDVIKRTLATNRQYDPIMDLWVPFVSEYVGTYQYERGYYRAP